MLDTTTKRNIDAARNVLVGKVPDPKAQVEQITTALIYKFMDDLDKESVELGGEAKFFSGDFEKFSWTKLIDIRLTGEGRLDLYVQAITSMDKNPNLPQLFRDIFKGAFLPYNDPQTLSLFLKEINKFNYGHSEELGNAFEYLLSVLGSQGDAGQFRTPRHIIDFIVEVIDPKKNETILDPACGTAGFLISAYKHIRKQNSSNFKPDKKEESVVGETAAEAILHDDPVYQGDLLTPSERKKLMKNIQGYDISPDMVRLSLVNLYLHGFPGPKIFEYDTLSSEKRWGETFDVILANPPFMTPKGGIRPHKRFQVQANRSEVLFVDYILEHLNINGRAGIIVPEGVIFKSENAYKRLRKLLIEDGLFAVVSLPSGVFNPYSGVKTSILMFDNQVAKKTDEILFIKIENDGYGLGAQRRKIKKNDLPEALEVITTWKNGKKQESNLALWVNKEKIAKDGDFNLSCERYKDTLINNNQDWPIVELGNKNLFSIESGGTPSSKNDDFWNGNIYWITLVDLPQENRITFVSDSQRKITEAGLKGSSAKLLPANTVVVSSRATIGRIGITEVPLSTNQGFKNIVIKDFSKVDHRFLANVLLQKVEEMERLGTGGTYKEISKTNMARITVPLPPLEIQQEIVAQIEVKQAVINGAKAVIENLDKERRYFGHELWKMEDVGWVTLGDMCEINSESENPKSRFGNGPFTYLDISSIENGTGRICFNAKLDVNDAPSRARRIIQNKDVIISTVRPNLRAFAFLENLPERSIASTGFAVLRAKKGLEPKYLYGIINSDQIVDQMIGRMGKGAYPSINQTDVKQIKIPLPSLEIQKQLVVEVDNEQKVIEANRNLIDWMEQKIMRILERV